jgi:hypothetical protein
VWVSVVGFVPTYFLPSAIMPYMTPVAKSRPLPNHVLRLAKHRKKGGSDNLKKKHNKLCYIPVAKGVTADSRGTRDWLNVILL